MLDYSEDKLALIVGNSRLHWGWFQGKNLKHTWDTPHLKKPIQDGELPTDLFPQKVTRYLAKTTFVYLVSVVGEQKRLWDNFEPKKVVTLDDIPLSNIYSTLGVDRALCVYGAGETYSYPVLVIDGGTALTYTAVGKHRQFLGGAILPGLTLQLQALATQTDALPQISLPKSLPQLWSYSTVSAIASGIIHTTIAGIYDYLSAWWKTHPDGVVILTGGDAILLYHYFEEKYRACAENIIVDQTLMFQGIANLMDDE